MKRNLITMFGALFGFLFLILSELRYFVIYPDLDRALVYGIVGLLIIFCSWTYGKLRHLDNKLFGVENYLSDITENE